MQFFFFLIFTLNTDTIYYVFDNINVKIIIYDL